MPKFKHTETGDEVDFPDGSFYAELAAESPEWQDVSSDTRPTKKSSKDEWVAWAIANGVPSFEAHAMTKDELVERLGD